jgi:hypothetical protein
VLGSAHVRITALLHSATHWAATLALHVVKPSTEQVAALPDHSVPATPANVTPGGANQRSATPAGNIASANAT